MKWIKQHKITSFWLFFSYLSLVFLLTYRLNDQVILLEGGLTKINQVIEVNNTTQNQFNSIYVVSMEKPTLFQYLIASMNNKNTITTRGLGYENYTLLDYYKMGQLDEQISFQNAIIHAYEKASEQDIQIHIDRTLIGYLVTYYDKNQRNIELGDIVTEVDYTNVSTLSRSDFYNLFLEAEKIQIVVNRNGNQIETFIERLDTGIFGVKLDALYDINANPSYQSFFQNDLIGGPSGGLMQTLTIYADLLNLDFSHLKIAGTGTILEDGKVGPIGGLKQKLFTANSHKVDLFFVPKVHSQLANDVYELILNPSFVLIEVEDIDEAIEALLSYL